MWIRNQDKKSLLKAKEIRIEIERRKEYILEKELPNYKPEDVHTDILFGEMNIHSLKTEYRYYVYKSIGYIVVNDKKIARYSTEEKALKVLDMIERFFNDVEYHKTLGHTLDEYVYQLPQDEEVE